MTQHKSQRVGVFVDVQNLYYSAKQLYGTKVNFREILKEAVKGRELIRAIAYVIKADVKDESNFFDALEKIGFEVRAKDLQVFYGGAKKGDWDVGIAMDTMRMASKMDVVVLVSGDGDFCDLLEHLQSLGCRCEVIAFGKTSSSKLIAKADMYTDMDKQKRKFLIGGPRAPSPIPRRDPRDDLQGRKELRDIRGEVHGLQREKEMRDARDARDEIQDDLSAGWKE